MTQAASELAVDYDDLLNQMEEYTNKLELLSKVVYGDGSRVKVSYEKKSDKDGLAYELHVAMVRDGVSQMRLEDRTVYIRHELRGTAVDNDNDAMIKALETNGLDDLVNRKPSVPWKRLQSWLNEQERDEDNMPILPSEELDAVINVTMKESVQSRRSA